MNWISFCGQSSKYANSKFRFLLVMLLFMIFNGCTLFKINVTPSLGPLKEKTVSGEGDDKVLLIDIKGTISNKKQVSCPGSGNGCRAGRPRQGNFKKSGER